MSYDKAGPVKILKSSPMIHAPGIIAYMVRVYATDQYLAVELLASSYADLTVSEAISVLNGKYEVDGDDVIVNMSSHKEINNESV